MGARAVHVALIRPVTLYVSHVPRRALSSAPERSGKANREKKMLFTRRRTLQVGLAGIAATTILPYAAMAQSGMGDAYEVEGGEIRISPVSHASFVMTVPGMTIYSDPVGAADLYAAFPRPDLILVTHEHGDHFNAETLAALAGDDTKIVVNPAVFEKLPDALKAKATALANGENALIADVAIDAIPAYNTTEDRKKYHPQGRDNGYVLTIGDRRVYIAGDTEDIPEMRELTDIFIAFVPMNLPFTMDVTQAASAVAAFKPAFVYPYHFKGQDPKEFEAKVTSSGAETKVVHGAWYG